MKTETRFIDENMSKNKNIIVRNLEPKMLPTRFRERTAFSQRLYLFMIVFLYALAVGVITFTLLAGIAEKTNDVFKDRTLFLILSVMISLVTLFSGSITPLWTRNRKGLFTLFEFINIAISPFVYIFAYTYLSFLLKEADYIDNPKKLLFVFGLISFASNAVPIMLTIIKTLLNRKRYLLSLQKTILISIGNIIISTTNLAFWYLSKFNESTKVLSFNATSFVGIGSIMGVGLFLTMLGLIISMKWDILGARSIWTSVRISGALPSLVIYSALIAIGLRFMKLQLSAPLLIAFCIDSVLLILLTIYVWFKGRVNNLIKTNPIYNNIILKLFTILVAFTGMINIFLMEKLVFLKNYGPTSFEILALTSIVIIVGIFIAHIGKLITYSKLFKASIIGSFTVLFIILLVVVSIIVLKNSEIILGIISKQIVSIFLICGLIVDVLLLFIDISLTSLNLFKGSQIRKGDK